MRALIESLCSDACAGRATGTQGGALARTLVMDALRDAGLDPFTQAVPASNGENVLATVKGDVDRYVMVAAHYDHLGATSEGIFRGADDNAAAVAILVEVARAMKQKRADGRGVIFAAFDAEEPPHFMTAGMGSVEFVKNPIVPLDRIDLMVCMDLVGHALGDGAPLPDDVKNTVFALGAERSVGTADRVRALARSEKGLVVRPADAQIVPKLSDYAPFWSQSRPFLFLTNGRSHRYHTPDDTPEHVNEKKIGATARWLERFVRDACIRDAAYTFDPTRDDKLTLDSLIELLTPLADVSDSAEQGLALARMLRKSLGKERTLLAAEHDQLEMLVYSIEHALA